MKEIEEVKSESYVHKGLHHDCPVLCNTQRKNAVARDCRGRDSDSQGCFLSDVVVSKGQGMKLLLKKNRTKRTDLSG